MALPTSGSISINDIKAELGISGELELTDSRVRALAGIGSGSITLPNDLWGKSARSISIYFAGGGRVSDGGQNYHDQIVFGVQVSDGAMPSSYQWGGDFYSTGSTVQFDGPSYNLNGYTYISSGYVEVTVVISGQTYTASRTYSFTAGDEM